MKHQEPWIEEAAWPRDGGIVAQMLGEYLAGIEQDIRFQNVDAELATLPGKYARPEGAVFLARTAAGYIGMVAYRNLNGQACELKRLYVRPESRGRHTGAGLVGRAIEEARACGYRLMMLDTLASMRAATALYRSLGFASVPAYYDNPLPGTAYMALPL